MKKTKLGIITAVMFAASVLLYLGARYVQGDWKLVFAYMFVIATTLSVCIASMFFHSLLIESNKRSKVKISFAAASIASLTLSVICWIISINLLRGSTNIISLGVLAFAVASTIWTFSFAAMLLYYQNEKNTAFLSNVRIFVINDIFLGLAFSGMAIAFEILARTNAWNIIITYLILISYIPVALLNLICALIWYLRNTKKTKSDA